MPVPKILLSTNDRKEAYVAAVEQAGGNPEGGYCPEYREEYDGLILCGGVDVDPVRYGQEKNGTGTIDAARDAAEFQLIEAFLQAGKPIFGICRGCQILNIYFGGTLHQDIPTKASHRLLGAEVIPVHPVVTDDPLLTKLYGSEPFSVNSSHHQAVDQPGEGFRITAYCPEDGVAEGIVHERLPVFGVQWHPEKLSGKWRREDAVDGIGLFEYFVALCKEKMQ